MLYIIDPIGKKPSPCGRLSIYPVCPPVVICKVYK